MEEAGPTGPEAALHAGVDKAVGPVTLSVASRCSGSWDQEEQEWPGQLAQAWDVPMSSARAPRNPAKYCLAAGSCRATGGWLEAGQRSGALRMVLSITAQVLTSFLKILAKELIIVRRSAPRCLSRSGAAHTWA